MRFKLLTFLFAAALLVGCASVSSFDSQAYAEISDLRAESKYLVKQGTKRFSIYEAEVADLRNNLKQVLAHSRARPRNEISTEQLKALEDSTGYSLGGFLREWEVKDSLSALFVQSAAKIIDNDFKEILKLELSKTKE